eukprot:1869161-Amphidinium_carterae.1
MCIRDRTCSQPPATCLLPLVPSRLSAAKSNGVRSPKQLQQHRLRNDRRRKQQMPETNVEAL